MVPRHDQELERGAAPVRGDHGDVVGGEHHTFVGGELGLDGGAQQAAAGEAGEGTLLVEDLARHERQTEDLAVRMGDRGTGFAAVVDDGLGVSDLRCGGVVGEPVAKDPHQLARVVVVEQVQARVVIGRVHEHLVDAARLGHHEHRPEVVDSECLLAVEGRIAIGDHPHRPGAVLVDGLEGRWGRLLVTGAERAGPGRILDAVVTRCEVVRPLGPLGHDGHPPAVERVQTHLTHCPHEDTANVPPIGVTVTKRSGRPSARVRAARRRRWRRRRRGGVRGCGRAGPGSTGATPTRSAIRRRTR